MLLSPVSSSNPPVSLPMPVRKAKPVNIPARPASAASISRSGLIENKQPPRTTTTTTTTATNTCAINIPSPPLTPHMGYLGDDSGAHEDAYTTRGASLEDSIFSSRFRNTDIDTNLDSTSTTTATTTFETQYKNSFMRHSTSAPTLPSPLQNHHQQQLYSTAASLTKGFTFSSNIPKNQPKEERDSYAYFLKTMEEDYWKSVSTIHSTYFFDGIGRGGGFMAIPHLASHGNAKTNAICRLLESWLTKKLVDPTISDSIPVLEDNIQSSVQSIERHLRKDQKVWSGISQVFIHIQCGHVFMLDTCCDDETIVHLGADEFYQDYPLFVDVEIKMHCDSNHIPNVDPTEVLIAFRNVVSRNKGRETEKPFVHRAMIK